MALHSGLLWLADGFERHDKLAATSSNHYDIKLVDGAGDAHCPTNASHKLVLSNNKNAKPQKSSNVNTSMSKAAPRPRSARLTNCNCPAKAKVKNRAILEISAPVDQTPRAGAWTADASKDNTETQCPGIFNGHYKNLPTHPDLRYFDRHSRCYNHLHCADALVSTRPKTACSAGRVSLTQCECCGEVTSMIRYRYAPTGSAMTEMNASNKTFLYPEKLFSYDSYNSKRRPASAPSHSVCRRHPLHNYVIRGDNPHFCNFVKPCSVYDKVSGRKILEDTDAILNLLSSYDYSNSHQLLQFTPLLTSHKSTKHAPPSTKRTSRVYAIPKPRKYRAAQLETMKSPDKLDRRKPSMEQSPLMTLGASPSDRFWSNTLSPPDYVPPVSQTSGAVNGSKGVNYKEVLTADRPDDSSDPQDDLSAPSEDGQASEDRGLLQPLRVRRRLLTDITDGKASPQPAIQGTSVADSTPIYTPQEIISKISNELFGDLDSKSGTDNSIVRFNIQGTSVANSNSRYTPPQDILSKINNELFGDLDSKSGIDNSTVRFNQQAGVPQRSSSLRSLKADKSQETASGAHYTSPSENAASLNTSSALSDPDLRNVLHRIRSERISTVSFGDTRTKRQMSAHRKRPPSLTQANKKSTSKAKIMSKKSVKKKGLMDEDSEGTMLSAPDVAVATPQEVDDNEPVKLVEPPATAVEESQSPDSTPSPLPQSELQPELLHVKPKYSRKVGAGSREEEPLFETDQSAMLDSLMRQRRAPLIRSSTRDSQISTTQAKLPLRMQAWMNGRLALSKRSSRFELPIDMRVLETMTPLQYLSSFCVVTSKRQMLYDKIFMKQKSAQSGKLGYQELQKALSDVLIQSIDKQKMKLLLDMLLVDESVQIDRKLFHGVSAFAERLLYPIFARGDQFAADTQKENIETADFYALEWKFHGVNVNPPIRMILERL